MNRRGVSIAAAFAVIVPLAHGQPCVWEALDGATFTNKILALEEFDGGSGPQLFAAGVFTRSSGSPASSVARWDSDRWSQVGEGISGATFSLSTVDHESGSLLYAGGVFGRAGDFPHANGIAYWDGSQWSPLGTGLQNEDPSHTYAAWDMVKFDDGSGPALYVGGHFTKAGGVPARSIARWDGQEWTPVGHGFEGAVRALAEFDDGSGPALYAGGYFFGGVARWKDGAWEVGSGYMNVHAFAVFDDGTGPALYAGGQWGGGLTRWDGDKWVVVGGGTNFSVNALHVFDDGTGPALFVGGAFLEAGGKQAWGIAKWDGEEWHDLDGGIYEDRYFSVDSMTTFDDGSGPALYVAGRFTRAGGIDGVEVQNIARWRCEQACYADCDGDGELTFFDFLCFQNLFTGGDPKADCDESGDLDFFDFLCFQNAFARGCV